MVTHGPQLVMTLGRKLPIVAIEYDREGGPVGVDSGYLVVFSDGPPPEEFDETSPVEWLCLGCLIEDFPEVGAALDLARKVGEVWLTEDGWVPLEEIEP